MIETFALGLRVLLAVVLLVSTLGKAMPAGFRAARTMVRRLGVDGGDRLIVVVLVAVELTAALLLASERTALIGCVFTAILFAGLSGGVAFALRRDLDVECACFGRTSSRLDASHLARNVGLLVASLAAVLASLHSSGRPDVDTTVFAVGVGGLLALVVIHLDDIGFLLGRSV